MKILNMVRKVEYAFLAACMLGTTGLLFVNVVLRYFFHSAIFWAEEVLRYLIVWTTFIGAAVCVREKSHITLDTLVAALPAGARKAASVAGALVTAGAALYLMVISAGFAMKMRSTGQVSATIGNFPMYIVYSCMPIGFALYSIWSIRDLADSLRGRGGAAAKKEG